MIRDNTPASFRSAHPSGMTLVEIVIAAAILAIIMVAFSRAHITSLSTTRQVEEHQAASQAARNMLESIIKDQFTNLLGNDGEILRSDGKFAQEANNPKPAELAFNPLRRHPFVVYRNSWGLDVKLDNSGGYSETVTEFWLVNRDANDYIRVGMVLGYPQTSEKVRVDGVTVGADSRVKLDVTRGVQGTTAVAIPEGAHLFPLVDHLPGLVDEYAGEVVFITNETLGKTGYGGDLSPNDGLPDGVRFFQDYPVDLSDPADGDTTDPGVFLDLNVDGDSDDANAIQNESAIKIAVGVIIRWQGKYGEERHETWTWLTRY